MKNQSIEKFMTAMPHTINADMPLQTAKEMMRKYAIRHIPVQVAGKLVGVLTDRDLKLALSFQNAKELHVEDAMTPDPFAVALSASLHDTVSKMAEHKYGCSIIQNENGSVAGIFTATDGLKLLSKFLNNK